MELMESLEVIIKHYIPPALHKLFGTFAQDESILRDETRSGTNKDLLRVLRRAENKKDGPLFLRTLADINKLLRDYKSGALDDGGDFSKPQSEINRIDTELSGAAASERNRCRETSKSWNGVPVAVWNTILSETYQRCVGPSIPALRGYTPHSSETYGELEAVLISDIIHECNVTESTKLVDLGSGVGNVVLQASLQAGCQSYGIEIRTKLHELALKQREELEKRCRLWGVTCNDVELAEGDFRTCERTRVKLQEADVVLVNNFKFGPDCECTLSSAALEMLSIIDPVNAALSHMFLDMKEGAVVVTLNPLLPKNFSISIHTVSLCGCINARLIEVIQMSNPLAIFTQEEREYGRGCVSWSMVGGKYFMNTVDRAVLAEFAAKNEEKIKQFQDRVLKYQPAPPRRGRRA
jgi:[histone H3]-lysine79 N-trimethyltransferase